MIRLTENAGPVQSKHLELCFATGVNSLRRLHKRFEVRAIKLLLFSHEIPLEFVENVLIWPGTPAT